MGSMRERSPGRWELRVHLGRDSDGRARALSRIHRGDERSARRALARLEATVGGRRPAAPSVTVAEHLARWVAWRSPEWSPTQRATVAVHVDRHLVPALGEVLVDELGARDVDEWLSALRAGGLSPGYVRRIHTTLRAALEVAVRWELIGRNPAARAAVPAAGPGRRDVPGPELLQRALAAAPGPETAMFVRLAAATGARRGQLVALRWCDVDHNQAVITFARAAARAGGDVVIKGTKTGAVVRCPIDPGTLAAVRAYRAHRQAAALAAGAGRLPADGFLFAVDPAGTRCWHPDVATRRWQAVTHLVVDGDGARPLAGVRLHDLRHAHATLLVAGGIDTRTAAARLGHSRAMLLDRYAHPVTANELAAAELIGRHLDGAG